MSEGDQGDRSEDISDDSLAALAGGTMVVFGAMRPGVHVVLDGKPVTAAID